MNVIKNFYDPEEAIVNAIKNLFTDKTMFSVESSHKLDAEFMASIHDDSEKAACVIEYMGYAPDKTQMTGRSAILQMEYRITVVTPSELYNSLAGAIMVDVISNIIGIRQDVCGGTFEAIADVHQFHRPKFDTSLTTLHATFGHKVLIKPNRVKD